jgi:uncharacterized protein Usg
MYPPEVRTGTKSNAEHKVFQLIRTDLGDEWSALHSLGLTTHRTKPWAEIDFVVIGPPGVFCLEVKGGRIARQDGRYLYTDRSGTTTIKDQGPFEQVGPASAALYKYLIGTNSRLRRAAVGYGVITPDIEFKITGPDIEPSVVFDERDLCNPFGSYMRRLADYWHERLEAQGKQVEVLNATTHQLVLECLRGDFDLRPSLRCRIGEVNSELLRLTTEQYRVLDELAENERVIIRGGAGSGKTLLALEEARRRASTGEKIFLCCFNEGLGHDLRQAVCDLPNITAGHLHSFMAKQVSKAGLQTQLPAAQESDLFQVFYPELCLEAMLETGELASYDSIIVDEAQDLLLEPYLNVFDALLKGGLGEGNWRFFLDPNQDLFMGTSPACLQRMIQARPARFSLSTNCRNSAPIATLTHLVSGVPTLETLTVQGPEVMLHWYSDDNQQRRDVSNAVNRLLGEHVNPRDIVIIGARKLVNSGLRDGLVNVPFKLTDSAERDERTRVIRYSSVRAYKGREADAVLLIDVNDLESKDCLFNFYVGGTRARAYLEVFISENVRDQYSNRAYEFGRSLVR